MATIKKKNAGYEIILRCVIGEQGIALARCKNGPAPFVTWQFRTDAPRDMFWGKYLTEKGAAYRSFISRVKARYEEYRMWRNTTGASIPEAEYQVAWKAANLATVLDEIIKKNGGKANDIIMLLTTDELAVELANDPDIDIPALMAFFANDKKGDEHGSC